MKGSEMDPITGDGVWCPAEIDQTAPRGDDCVIMFYSAANRLCNVQFSNGWIGIVPLEDVQRPEKCHRCKYRLFRLFGAECPGYLEE